MLQKLVSALVGLGLVVSAIGCGHEDKDIHDLQAERGTQAALNAALEAQVSTTIQLLITLMQQQSSDEAAVASLQAAVSAQSVILATLQGYTGIVSIVDPCGTKPGYYNEVLLKLSNGQLLSSFSDNANGLNTHFAVLPDGNYATTDGTNCQFTVLNGSVTNEHY
jgi:hypothetical protein